MKKIASLITILFLTGSIAFGQSPFRFGFQLSPNFTWISTNDNRINGNGSNLGLKLGMIGERYFNNSDRYALMFGLGFAFNQGGTLKHDQGGNLWAESDLSDDLRTLPDGVNLKYGIQFVEIPIGLKMRTQEFGYLRYFAEPAFTLGIRTQARGSINAEGGIDAEDLDIKDDVGFLNLSWGIGAGVEYNIGESTTLVGGLFFQSGFIDITDDSGVKLDEFGQEIEQEDSKGTINNLTIRLAVMF